MDYPMRDDLKGGHKFPDFELPEWPFLMDTDRRLLHELEMADTTDKYHGDIYIPYTFVLDSDRTIYKIYNGWWYVGRPTIEELRMDLRALMSRCLDWVYSPDYKSKSA